MTTTKTNHPEGLFRRPHSKYWWMSYYAFDPVKRKRIKIHKSTGQTSQRKAKAARVATLEAIASGKHSPKSVERIRFEYLVEGLRADYKAKGNKSLDRALLAVKHLEGMFAGNRAIDITATRINKYMLDRIDGGAARATVRYELSVLNRMFRLAVRRGELQSVPVFPEMGDPHNAREGFFSEADVAALQLELPEHLRPLAEFAYLTSWRKQEMLDLQWKQIDWESSTIRLPVGTTKSKRGRTFPFGSYPALQSLLERQREYTEKWEQLTGQIIPWVFHRHGRQIKNYYTAWRSACKRAGLEGKMMHDFRRTAIRKMVRAGIPKHTAMQLSGHRTASVFDRYDIHDEQDLEEATAKLARSSADPKPAKTT